MKMVIIIIISLTPVIHRPPDEPTTALAIVADPMFGWKEDIMVV